MCVHCAWSEEAFTQYGVYTASCAYQSHFCPKEMGKVMFTRISEWVKTYI